MKFAKVNGERREAERGLSGSCPHCGAQLVAKVGEIRVRHWAHIKLDCDTWSEPETEWHREWKGYFPDEWQEISHTAPDGQIHRADVKTGNGWVLEVQYSHLKPEERRARDSFYPKLIWVVNGSRLKKAREQFLKSLGVIETLRSPHVGRICITRSLEGSLLRDWAACSAPVFVDFGKTEPALWCLLPKGADGNLYVIELSRPGFIDLLRSSSLSQDHFSDLLKTLLENVAEHSARLRARANAQPGLQILSGFQRHLAQQDRSRRRF